MKLTVSQIKKACSENKYIAMRLFENGKLYGVNCSVANIKMLQDQPDSKVTIWQSYYPICFSEYIRIKTTFIKSK